MVGPTGSGYRIDLRVSQDIVDWLESRKIDHNPKDFYLFVCYESFSQAKDEIDKKIADGVTFGIEFSDPKDAVLFKLRWCHGQKV